jgi:uncharacterized protein
MICNYLLMRIISLINLFINGLAMNKFKDVDEYISFAPQNAQKIMISLRGIIKECFPDIKEKISWNVPFYCLNSPIAGYALYTKHISFGSGGIDLPIEISARLRQKGFKTGKKTIQIKFDQNVPIDEIKEILLLQFKAYIKTNHQILDH